MQYHSYQMARGTKTADFIGDLALAFALNQTTGEMDDSRRYRDGPDYKGDLEDSKFLASVFKPEDIEYMPVLTRVTTQGADWGLAKHPDEIAQTGKMPSNTYSNYYHTQCIAPDSSFLGYILSDGEGLPETVRVGNQRGCLLKLETIEKETVGDLWVNLFTLNNVLGLDKISIDEGMEREDVIHTYQLLKNVSFERFKGWYSDHL